MEAKTAVALESRESCEMRGPWLNFHKKSSGKKSKHNFYIKRGSECFEIGGGQNFIIIRSSPHPKFLERLNHRQGRGCKF
jgi:hypothetical protein